MVGASCSEDDGDELDLGGVRVMEGLIFEFACVGSVAEEVDSDSGSQT